MALPKVEDCIINTAAMLLIQLVLQSCNQRSCWKNNALSLEMLRQLNVNYKIIPHFFQYTDVKNTNINRTIDPSTFKSWHLKGLGNT